MSRLPSRRQAAGRQLQQLIVTICALHARGDHGALAVAELIRLLATLDVDEAAARSALSRLKKRGVLLRDTQGRQRGIPARSAARGRLRGGRRTHLRPAAGEARRPLAARRVLGAGVAAQPAPPAAPGARRARVRHRRGAGLWIAPEFVHAHLRRELEREGLLEFVEFFAADLLDDQIERRVAEWWDLEALTAACMPGSGPSSNRSSRGGSPR